MNKRKLRYIHEHDLWQEVGSPQLWKGRHGRWYPMIEINGHFLVYRVSNG